LFAVRIFLCSNVHAKNLHFGSALAFHIGMIRSLLYGPSNRMWYALLDVYSPSVVQRHIMLSSLLASSWTCCTASHIRTYSWISAVERIGVMWEIHLLSYIAFCTMTFFFLAFLKKVGAKLLGAIPCTRDQVPNLVVLPSPIVTIVDVVKKSLSRPSHGSSNLFHALSFWHHWNHSQRRRSACAKHSKSRIPSPDLNLGSTGRRPVDHRMSSIDLVRCLSPPKKASSHSINHFYKPFEFGEHNHVVDWLRGEHHFYQRLSPSWR